MHYEVLFMQHITGKTRVEWHKTLHRARKRAQDYLRRQKSNSKWSVRIHKVHMQEIDIYPQPSVKENVLPKVSQM